VLRLKRGYKNVAYVLAHRYRFLLLPTTKVAVKFDLFLNSAWVRKKLENHDVYLWTVNEKSQFTSATNAEVKGIITNRPDLRE
jgi:glycerophosphoryl diester phosphodiesterase